MTKGILTALVLSAAMVQAAQASECVSISKIAGAGPFRDASIQLRDGRQVDMKIVEFFSIANPPQPVPGGFARVDPQECFGNPNSLRLGNASLMVGIEGGSELISFNFCDLGGYENVGANEDLPPKFIDDVRRINGEVLENSRGAPVEMEVSRGPDVVNSGGIVIGYEAKLVYRGEAPTDVVLFGGQELFIESICID